MDREQLMTDKQPGRGRRRSTGTECKERENERKINAATDLRRLGAGGEFSQLSLTAGKLLELVQCSTTNLDTACTLACSLKM